MVMLKSDNKRVSPNLALKYVPIHFPKVSLGERLCSKNTMKLCEPRHEISNNVVCVTSKDSDQPAHMLSLIIAFASRLNIL